VFYKNRYAPFRLIMFLLVCLHVASPARSQEPHLLSAAVQEFASQNGAYKLLGSPPQDLYIDILTAMDVVAVARVQKLANTNTARVEDFQFAGWSLCWFPWVPPKSAEDRKTIAQARVRLVSGAYLSGTKRKDIAARLNLDLLPLNAASLSSKKITPVAIINLKGLP